MEEKIHLFAAEEYLKVAEAKNQEYEQENDQNKRTALRIVAAQNYFYSTVNAIEAILANKVTYRGQNGKMYENIKKLARLLRKP